MAIKFRESVLVVFGLFRLGTGFCTIACSTLTWFTWNSCSGLASTAATSERAILTSIVLGFRRLVSHFILWNKLSPEKGWKHDCLRHRLHRGKSMDASIRDLSSAKQGTGNIGFKALLIAIKLSL